MGYFSLTSLPAFFIRIARRTLQRLQHINNSAPRVLITVQKHDQLTIEH